MLDSTRRDFLRVTALGMAATLTGGGLLRSAFAIAPQTNNISAWITDRRRRHAPLAGLAWQAAGAGKHLGPALGGTGTEIWMCDHNYDLWGRVWSMLEKKGVRKYAKGVAWHGYVGDAEMMSRIQRAFPDIGMHWTEGGPLLREGDMLHEWAKWGKTFSEILNNSCRSITSWNLALDEKGRPNVGPFFCAGMVTVHSKTREIIRSAQYWTMAHFSRHMRTGAVRIGTESGAGEKLSHVAARNPDGSKALVLTNQGGARRITVRAGDRVAEIALPGDSVTTLAWM